MTENRKCFTFIWKIKNLILAFIESPGFFVHELGGSQWRLFFSVYCDANYRTSLSCYIQRAKDDQGPDELKLNYELSFIACDGTVVISQTILEKVFKKGYGDRTELLHVKTDEVFPGKYIPANVTLTIRCRMWDSKKSISSLVKCLAETRILPTYYGVGTIGKFSFIEPGGKYPVNIKSCSETYFPYSINLCVVADDSLEVEIQITGGCSSFGVMGLKIWILDKLENKFLSVQSVFLEKTTFFIPLSVLKEYIIKNKEQFLTDDVLTIRFEIFHMPLSLFWENFVTHEVEYVLDDEDTQGNISNTRTDVSSENLTTLKDDWVSLFREGVLCDTKLKTATETFPAHTLVLSARSSVFQSMFTTDMREKTNNCIDIVDLDADTVRRMLLFMYSDSLDDLKYESAKSLYFAADKYNITSLKHRCSNFLKQNISHSNCVDILLFSDKHQDIGLKSVVQEYIAKNNVAILSSDEWKNLEMSQPHLALEVFRFIFIKNRSN